jgi:hypothetical protein
MAEDKNSGIKSELPTGPCLAKVISHLDTSYMGSLEVQLLRPGSGNDTSAAQVQQVKYMSPFYGVTGFDYVTNQNDYNNTQKSYGMWFVPPDVGTLVVVIFVNDDPGRGYWIGCVPDEGMNFMIPGIAATQNSVDSATADAAGRPGRVPVAEYNKLENNRDGDSTQFKKPQHPLVDALASQGLLLDDTRGITTSSARRETPSMVFGISTPGPFDKKPTAKTGAVGKSDSRITNAPVSHIGGSTFVMDDGDDKFLRKTPAGTGGPSYAAIEQGETGGNVDIPHNELIRIRTRTGHQILLHNSEDLIYIGNASGSTWIELTSNGKIDIFAEDSISIHTSKDFNFHAGRDINLEAGRNVNVKAGNNIHAESAKNTDIVIGQNGKITTLGKMDVNTTGSNKFTAGTTTEINSGGNQLVTAAKVHMNGPIAAIAEIASPLLTHILPSADGSTFESIMRRVPTHEPYPQHENLDPLKYSSDKTDRNVDNQLTHPTESMKEPAAAWKNYSTTTDTFNKITG